MQTESCSLSKNFASSLRCRGCQKPSAVGAAVEPSQRTLSAHNCAVAQYLRLKNMSFTSGTSKWQDLLSQQRSPQADRELIDAVVAGGARAHRLWTHGVELFEHGAERAELPPGWEQRVDQGSGRIFFLQQGTDKKFALVSQSNGYYNLPSPNTNDKLGTSLAASGDSDGHIVAGAPTATNNAGEKGTFVIID